MLHALIEKLSDYPAFFLFCRGILEANFRVIRETIVGRLEPSTSRAVLDVACGPGAFSDLFPADSYSGIDLNPKYIAYAKKKYQGRFAVQDATKLDFPENTFDDVLVYGLLHHLSDEDVCDVLSGIGRVLRPNGRALIIEDIPTESRLNVVGHLLHWMENGHFIRPAPDYRALINRQFNVVDERLFRSGICDYYMAELTPTDKHSSSEQRQAHIDNDMVERPAH